MKRGVFWLIEGKLHCFPFDGSYPEGIAKSGNTYNHEKLWQSVRPHGCRKPFDYYPRGRVEITPKGKAVIYMSPHITEAYLPEICGVFGLNAPTVKYDHSAHYRCYLDEEDAHEA